MTGGAWCKIQYQRNGSSCLKLTVIAPVSSSTVKVKWLFASTSSPILAHQACVWTCRCVKLTNSGHSSSEGKSLGSGRPVCFTQPRWNWPDLESGHPISDLIIWAYWGNVTVVHHRSLHGCTHGVLLVAKFGLVWHISPQSKALPCIIAPFKTSKQFKFKQ